MENNQVLGSRSSMDDLKKLYGEQDWWSWFEETASQNEETVSVRHIKGQKLIDGDLILDEDPWAVIIDGNMEVNGTVICNTPEGRISTLVVLGKLQAENLFYSGSAQLLIKEDTTINGFVVGTWGDGGATLGVNGTLTARGVLLDPHTPAEIKHVNALIMCGEGWSIEPDFLDGDHPELFVHHVLDRGGPFVDFKLVRKAALAGEPVFDPAAEQAWRMKK